MYKHTPIIMLFIFISVTAVSSAFGKPPRDLDKIRLPKGFSIAVYAENLDNARQMELSPGGVLYVGTRNAGNVYALIDRNGDYKADERYTIAEGLNMPNGVQFRDGDLYVAEIGRILRYENIEDDLASPPEPQVITDRYPTDKWHGWKYIRFGPDGYLYVPVGSPCNVCDPDKAIYSTITRIRPDGSGYEVYANGIRNTVGFDWNPKTGVLWFTDNGRDWFGDNKPGDELNRAAEKGLHFGFPHFHAAGIPDPDYSQGHDAADYVEPIQVLGPHVAALGMRFYDGDMFPDEYANQIFLAEHGSWNRSEPIGARVMLVRHDGKKALSYEVFAEGWQLENGKRWGRPVDVYILPDGSMLVSDDHGDAIYRISYDG